MRCLAPSLGPQVLRHRPAPRDAVRSGWQASTLVVVLLGCTHCGVFEGGQAEADRSGPEPASAPMDLRAQVYTPSAVSPASASLAPTTAEVDSREAPEPSVEALAGDGPAAATDEPSPIAADAQWSVFRSKPGRFHAAFPTRPQPGQRVVGTPVGELTNWEFRARHGRTEYVVNYTDIPKFLAATVPSRRVLKGSRDRTVEKLGGRLVSDRDISEGRTHAREFEIDVHEEGVRKRITMRNYLVGNRLYHLVHRRPAERTTTADLRRFFSSFSFLRD